MSPKSFLSLVLSTKWIAQLSYNSGLLGYYSHVGIKLVIQMRLQICSQNSSNPAFTQPDETLKNLNINKTSGPDKIPPSLLYHCLTTLAEPLVAALQEFHNRLPTTQSLSQALC